MILTFEEAIPSVKKYSAVLEEHWKAMIHAAIQKAAAQERLPQFERASVQVEGNTPRGSNNHQLWDNITCHTSNCFYGKLVI